jgi:hypothetical protein
MHPVFRQVPENPGFVTTPELLFCPLKVLPATVLPIAQAEVEEPQHTDPITSALVFVIAPVCPFKDVTPPAGSAADVQVVPLDVSTLPLVPTDVKPVPP